MSALPYVVGGLALLFGLVSVYLLLPKVRERSAFERGLRGVLSAIDRNRLKIGVPAGVIALALAGASVLAGDVRSAESILFYLFSAAAIVGGALLITQRNPARAAVSFVLVVLSTCGLFLILGAPFIAAGTAIIYAGAIVVTFLFVLMLAQQDGPSDADDRTREPLLSTVAGFVLLGGILYLIHATFGTDELDALVEQAGKLEARANEVSQESEPRTEDLVRESRAIHAEVGTLKDALDKWDGAHRSSSLPPGFASTPEERQRADELMKTPEARLRKAIDNLGTPYSALGGRLDRNPSGRELQETLTKLGTALADVRREGRRVRPTLGEMSPPVPAGELSDLSGPPATLPHEATPPRDQLRVDEYGRPPLPAQNTEYLGRSLFGDYLVPVGAAGVLLLVATIGAVAIATRPRDEPRHIGRAP